MVQIGCPALFLGSAPRFLRVQATPVGTVLMAARRPTRAAARALLIRLGEAQAAKELPANSSSCVAWPATGRPPGRDGGPAGWPAKSARGAVAPHRGAISPGQSATLFLWGEREPYAPPQYATRARTVVPNVVMQLVAGGHLPWLDDPSACGDAIIRFLGEEH
jgi:pimeloyl-ACP methyl ester carboxylesterase